MFKTTLLLSLIFASTLASAADCQRAALREARSVLGNQAQVSASMSEGVGDDHFIIRFNALLNNRRVGVITCESYQRVCNCRYN